METNNKAKCRLKQPQVNVPDSLRCMMRSSRCKKQPRARTESDRRQGKGKPTRFCNKIPAELQMHLDLDLDGNKPTQ